MLRQVRLLTALHLCNAFGFNEFRHGKDPKKRRLWLGLSATWVLLFLVLIAYVLGLCVGLTQLNMGEVIPEYLYAVAGLVILFFTFFKAGSVIFQTRGYDALISLPLSRTAIVFSRFLTMYVSDLGMSLLVMMPGMLYYGVSAGAGARFYLTLLPGMLFLPLLPITLATILGAGITAVSARMKHRSLVNALLSLALGAGVIVLSTASTGSLEQLSAEILKNYAGFVAETLKRVYPPAFWFSEAVVGGSGWHLLLVTLAPTLLFVCMLALLSRNFGGICAALNASSARGNYRLRAMKTATPLRALFRREMKRYFASAIYVANTLMGYVLMPVAAVALFFTGPETLETAMGMPGVVTNALPVLLGAIAALMSTTCCSISMEGKQWWIAKTLPVNSRDILASKLLVNLALALPGYVLAVVFGCLATRPSPLGALWLILLPAEYILYSAVAGLTVNLALPLMTWDNETRVVKQSASTLVAMLAGMVAYVPPIVCLLALKNVSADLILLVTALVLALATALLWWKNTKKSLLAIE